MVDPPPPLATVSNIEISTPLVTDAATEPGVEEFYVRVLYNQRMSLTASPTIDFSQPLLSDGGAAGVGTFELDRSRSTWQDQSHYIAWYKVTDQNVKYDSPIQVDVWGRGTRTAITSALHQPAAVHRGHGERGPAPASVTNIVVYGLKQANVVTAADAGDTITIFVKYDQAMDNRDAPWVGIYDGGDANAFEFTGGTWNGDHTYAANFVVHDTDLIWNDVRVRVIDAVDVTGRVQYEYNNYSAFSINTVSTPADMAGPLVQSTTTITDATTTTVVHDTGAANFVVLVYYNMDMAGHHPTVTFETFPGYEGAVAAAPTPDPDDCGWWNPREYQAAFYVNDVAANVPDVFIDVSGGIDSTHYGTQYFYEGGHFSINIVGPLAQQQTAPKTAALTDAVPSSGRST